MENGTRPAFCGTKTVAILYGVTALICMVVGLLLQSAVLFADGVISLLLFTETVFGKGKPSVPATVLRVVCAVLGAYASVSGFFSLSSLIGYARDTASIYVFPVFALLIVTKVAIILFSDGESSSERGLGLGVTLLALVGTVLTFVFYHYFDPAFAAAIGMYALYRGIKGFNIPKEDNTSDLPAEETAVE